MKELWLEKEPSAVYGGKINQLINKIKRLIPVKFRN